MGFLSITVGLFKKERGKKGGKLKAIFMSLSKKGLSVLFCSSVLKSDRCTGWKTHQNINN